MRFPKDMRRGDEGEGREEKERKGEKGGWRERRRQERGEESLEGDTADVMLELLLRVRGKQSRSLASSNHCLHFPPTPALAKPRRSLGNAVCSPDPARQCRQGG